MHDCRLGFPSIACWIADQYEGRKEQVTPAQPRLSEQEQSERRKLDVPTPLAAINVLDTDGWVEWDRRSGMPEELSDDMRVDVMFRSATGVCLTHSKRFACHLNWEALSPIIKWRLSK